MEQAARGKRGGAANGPLIGLGVFVLLALLLGGCKYNGLVNAQEAVDANWSEIQNQYKRRFDLIPQLVKTVRGAADFERSTLQDVIEARSSVGKVQLGGDAPTDPAQLKQFIEAQDALGSALNRLMVVVERYPTLKASQNFLSLQDQIEGTENRIATARFLYIKGVAEYNARTRRFPGNIMAGMFGFEKVAQLEFDDNVEAIPDLEFDFGANSEQDG